MCVCVRKSMRVCESQYISVCTHNLQRSKAGALTFLSVCLSVSLSLSVSFTHACALSLSLSQTRTHKHACTFSMCVCVRMSLCFDSDKKSPCMHVFGNSWYQYRIYLFTHPFIYTRAHTHTYINSLRVYVH